MGNEITWGKRLTQGLKYSTCPLNCYFLLNRSRGRSASALESSVLKTMTS